MYLADSSVVMEPSRLVPFLRGTLFFSLYDPPFFPQLTLVFPNLLFRSDFFGRLPFFPQIVFTSFSFPSDDDAESFSRRAFFSSLSSISF